jgi:hypothetical protein
LGFLFFLGFFLSPDLHTSLLPSYPTNLAILFTYILSLPTNYNEPPYPFIIYPFKVKFIPFGKMFISSWLNLYLLTKNNNSLVGWKSFKVYHIRQKRPSIYCNPFSPYILIPIKNNESKVVKKFRMIIFYTITILDFIIIIHKCVFTW